MVTSHVTDLHLVYGNIIHSFSSFYVFLVMLYIMYGYYLMEDVHAEM